MYLFFSDYVRWHYGRALVLYVRISKNLWWFIVQFFSLTSLLASFFAPYKRIVDDTERGWNLEAWAGSIAINLLSRLIGMGVRLVLIVIGIIILTGFTMAGFVGYLLWLGAPVLILSSYGYGMLLLIAL